MIAVHESQDEYARSVQKKVFIQRNVKNEASCFFFTDKPI